MTRHAPQMNDDTHVDPCRAVIFDPGRRNRNTGLRHSERPPCKRQVVGSIPTGGSRHSIPRVMCDARSTCSKLCLHIVLPCVSARSLPPTYGFWKAERPPISSAHRGRDNPLLSRPLLLYFDIYGHPSSSATALRAGQKVPNVGVWVTVVRCPAKHHRDWLQC